ncbi:sugar phosphate nucleotidyltransferase [uncultured Candidatus Kuenenia sp.]|uniref:sugar phosphate nucleotidyltransferase n=1 Tax=uncultured Candidatus Kuenenia sp. TaxID=1048336 RepID=UPI0025CDC8C3|nr:sugar phosphate nucleotidyltransferase [uncultured Candidatus Kuenenia sp.]
MRTKRDIVGLIPAGGKASRISPLPCSKELYPIGFRYVENNNARRPKVVSHYILEKMRMANITKAYIILREGKWDIPTYYGDGKLLDMHLAYLMMDLPYGVPYTLDQAYPFVQDALVVLGFPDIMFQPDNAYVRVLDKQAETGSDIVLGLFPTDRPHKNDMVELDTNSQIRALHIKPENTQLTYTWQIAVWTPAFTDYMHNYVSGRKESDNLGHKKELFVGDVIQAAIENKIRIDSVLFKEGNCLDIGTPEDLMKALYANLAKENQGDQGIC